MLHRIYHQIRQTFETYKGNLFFCLLLIFFIQDLYRDVKHCVSIDSSQENEHLSSPSRSQRIRTCTFMLRFIGLSYLVAFSSMYTQIHGLCGVNGLFPVKRSLEQTIRWISSTKFNIFSNPAQAISIFQAKVTLIMLKDAMKSDDALVYFMTSSCIVAALGIVFPYWAIYLYLYMSYLSLRRITSQVTNLQWDALILEAGVYASLLALAIGLQNDYLITICNWPFKLLLFRLMFGSGFVKLYSGDSSWTFEGSFTAMCYHFLTQPLPNSLSPLLHALPKPLLQLMTIGTLIIELLVPFLSWAPFLSSNTARFIQAITACLYSFLMFNIATSGHFG